MNPIETFGEFSSKLKPTDLMLYAGVGIVLFVLFKDKLSPVQKIVQGLLDKLKASKSTPSVSVPTNASSPVVSDDVFFNLVTSWKQTRDLAVQSGCKKAVEVADQMFPYLSPMVCSKETVDEPTK